jgi:hypothetical protein
VVNWFERAKFGPIAQGDPDEFHAFGTKTAASETRRP